LPAALLARVALLASAMLHAASWPALAQLVVRRRSAGAALAPRPSDRKGGKMYIQDKVEEYGDEVFSLLDNGAHMYFCGLKGMMPGIQEMLERVATAKGINYEEFVEKLKHNGQWHVEVY
jgi:ferredoxin--NADP+ reductase